MGPSRAASLLLALGSAAPALAQDPDWLLVRGEADRIGTLTWERMGEAYLGTWTWKIVRADDSELLPATSRYVIGTPDDNAAIAGLAPQLGIGFDGESVRYDGETFPAGAGFALSTVDPDGGGQIVVFTGATPAAVYNTFSVNFDMTKFGYTAMRQQEIVHRHEGIKRGLTIAAVDVRVLRLDRDLHYLMREMRHAPVDEAALRISRAFEGYRDVFVQALGPDLDLLAFTRAQLLQHAAVIDAARERWGSRDLDAEIAALYELTARTVTLPDGPRPVFYTIVTLPEATNGTILGREERTGRPQVILNLTAFPDELSFRITVVHESIHTLQPTHGGRLLERAVNEGVATLLSQEVISEASDAEALMWTPEKLAAAEERRDAIFNAFEAKMGSRDPGEYEDFTYKDEPLASVPGAPDRCAYWIGFLAAKAWRERNPDAPAVELLRANADELVAALFD